MVLPIIKNNADKHLNITINSIYIITMIKYQNILIIELIGVDLKKMVAGGLFGNI